MRTIQYIVITTLFTLAFGTTAWAKLKKNIENIDMFCGADVNHANDTKLNYAANTSGKGSAVCTTTSPSGDFGTASTRLSDAAIACKKGSEGAKKWYNIQASVCNAAKNTYTTTHTGTTECDNLSKCAQYYNDWIDCSHAKATSTGTTCINGIPS